MKLKWRVSDVPTGRYRSFERRGWPSADFTNGDTAVGLYCKDEYRPADVKTGNHAEIVIRIADYSEPSNKETGAGFTWRQLKKRAATLAEAKELASKFFDKYPQFLPKELQS